MDQFGLSKENIQKILKVLAQYSQIESAVIYGSRAKGNYKPGSDIDLCVIAPTMDLSLKFKLENELDDLLLPYKIDLSLFHKIENKDLKDHILRVGKEIYKNNFLKCP
ncbi:MAG: nucleotidyltransferase domain-containing protein [Pseudobdellovibrionaceae bacterium]